MARPPVKKPELPPAVFDPGEVTATYPIGSLLKNHGTSDSDDGIQEIVGGLREGSSLHSQATEPLLEIRAGTPNAPFHEKRGTTKPEAQAMSPTALFVASLLGGGGLALIVFSLGLAAYLTFG